MQVCLTLCLALQASVAAPQPAATGTIRGRVLFGGNKPPTFKSISYRAADPFCEKFHASDPAPSQREFFVVNPNGTVRDVLVYLRDGVPKREWPLPREPLLITQKGCAYVPHVVAVRVDQELAVRNDDETLHNVHTAPRRNTPFNVAQPRAGMTTTRKFSVPELGISLRCDVHPWMEAWIHVLDHPFFAVTGVEGSFELRNVPAGKYVLAVWQERSPEKSIAVTVTAGEIVTCEFSIDYRDPGK